MWLRKRNFRFDLNSRAFQHFFRRGAGNELISSSSETNKKRSLLYFEFVESEQNDE
jgi:hypothetical protein